MCNLRKPNKSINLQTASHRETGSLCHGKHLPRKKKKRNQIRNAQTRFFHVQQTVHSSSPQRQTVTAACRDGVWKWLYMGGQHIRKPEYWADFTHFNKDVLQKPSNHTFCPVVYKAVFLLRQVSELQVKPSSPHRGVFSFINIAVCLSEGSSITFITLYALKWQHTRLIRAEEPPTARRGLCVQITMERRGARPLIWSQTHQDAAGSHLKQLQRWWSETGWGNTKQRWTLVAAQPLFWQKSQGLKHVDAEAISWKWFKTWTEPKRSQIQNQGKQTASRCPGLLRLFGLF